MRIVCSLIVVQINIYVRLGKFQSLFSPYDNQIVIVPVRLKRETNARYSANFY